MPHDDETLIRVVTIVVLGGILFASVVGLTVVAIMTDRNMVRAESMTFGGVVLLAVLGGLSWAQFHRRKRWRVNVERNEDATD